MRRSAEHGFTPSRRFAEHGFTLVELMVVLVVIGLAVGAAVLAIPDERGRLADEADLFAKRVHAAHDDAIAAGHPISVWVEPGGYGFDERLGGRWFPMSEPGLRVTRWREGTRASPASGAARARVVFDETGLADRPLDVTVAHGSRRLRVDVRGDGIVRVDA